MVSKAEQETYIYLSPIDKDACIYSSDPTWMRRLEKMAEKRPDLFQLTKQYEDSVEYSCPKKCVKVSPPRVCNLTDEQKATRAEFLRTYMAKQREEKANGQS